MSALHAFAGYGVELEYMIVDRRTLAVRPIADRLLRAAGGGNEVARGQLAWSNELVLHLIELKNASPTPALAPLAPAFQAEVDHLNGLLAAQDAQLMPSAMHPWMDPRAETRLWPHDNAEIYRAFDRIFDCRAHGWANLQSMQLNLPFADDAEFARLHAAIRLLLPILPALAASSPIAAGRPAGLLDFRLEAYRSNALQIPSITGLVIPETVTSRADYEARILAPMYRDIAPFDPGGVLQHEWLNARGAIAHFDRGAIEIRVIDMQECPRADLAIAAASAAAIQALYDARWAPPAAQQAMGTEALAAILRACMRDAERALIGDAGYLRLLGFPGRRCEARELWRHLLESTLWTRAGEGAAWREPLRVILEQGPLARRILRALGPDWERPRLAAVYRALCDCLAAGRLFTGLP